VSVERESSFFSLSDESECWEGGGTPREGAKARKESVTPFARSLAPLPPRHPPILPPILANVAPSIPPCFVPAPCGWCKTTPCFSPFVGRGEGARARGATSGSEGGKGSLKTRALRPPRSPHPALEVLQQSLPARHLFLRCVRPALRLRGDARPDWPVSSLGDSRNVSLSHLPSPSPRARAQTHATRDSDPAGHAHRGART
jgi:hypothetical protein